MDTNIEYPDTWGWGFLVLGCCSQQGEFSFNSAWEVVREHHPQFPPYSLIWNPYSSPKMSTCTLRAIHDKLLTRTRLESFQTIQGNGCVLCESAAGSEEHAFPVHILPISRLYVSLNWNWTLIFQNLKLRLKTYSKDLKGRNKESALAFTSAIWHIWHERNSRIFNHQKKEMVFRRLYEDINILLKTSHWMMWNERPYGVVYQW